MRELDEIRPHLNKGKYLFFNPVLRAAIGAIDWFLSLRARSSKDLSLVQPRRILICMQAHIGDALMATSVLPVLSAAFPNAKFGMLVHPTALMAVKENPKLQWIHSFHHIKLNRQKASVGKKLVEHWRTRSIALKEVRDIQYDMAIDLYAFFPNSIPLLVSAGVPIRLGWKSGGFGALLTNGLEWTLKQQQSHVVEWHKELLSLLPACRAHIMLARPNIHGTDEDKAIWQALINLHGFDDGYVVFHVGAGGAHRMWPEKSWRELLQIVGASGGFKVVLMGFGSEEEGMCQRLMECAPDGVIVVNLAGKITWPVMSAGISLARSVVGLDSSPVHVAAAWGVPVVCIAPGIHGATWRPYSQAAKVIISPTPCYPCHLPGGCEGMECLRRTQPAVVFDALRSVERLSAGDISSSL